MAIVDVNIFDFALHKLSGKIEYISLYILYIYRELTNHFDKEGKIILIMYHTTDSRLTSQNISYTRDKYTHTYSIYVALLHRNILTNNAQCASLFAKYFHTDPEPDLYNTNIL